MPTNIELMDALTQFLLSQLLQTSNSLVFLSFLLENAIIVFLVLLVGRVIQKIFSPQEVAYRYTPKEVLVCSVNILLNTIFTYIGFWFWKEGIIDINVSLSWYSIVDFLLLFLAMDFLMFVFHFTIHKTPAQRYIHQLHHQAVDPKPIDLFVLHPIETMCFGSLWLCLLWVYPFNFYSIIVYLTLNVVFGMIGHLSLEPVSEKLLKHPIVKLLGTSTYHHQHHRDVNYNFGFYTTIWDRLFGTLKE